MFTLKHTVIKMFVYISFLGFKSQRESNVRGIKSWDTKRQYSIYITGFQFYVAWNQTPVGDHSSITSACFLPFLDQATQLISRPQHFFIPTLIMTSAFRHTHPYLYFALY